MAINIGEIDELKAKLSLIYWRDNSLNNIETVGFYNLNPLTYFEYPSHSYDIITIQQMTTPMLKTICNNLGISKASSTVKADVYINGKATSLKSKRGAAPSFINHTHRAGIEKVCARIKLDIKPLDMVIDNYWDLRLDGKIKEDVKMDRDDTFSSIKSSTLVPLLSYFLFKGTAKGDSPLPAAVVSSFEDPTNYNTWIEYSLEEATETLIESVTISIRSKAIPKTYDHLNPCSDRDKSIKCWTNYINGKYKGALHVRG